MVDNLSFDSLFDRQIDLLGEEKQERLESSTVLVVGCGGLGSLTAMNLANAGVNLKLVDGDLVEESNLHRTIYRKEDIGHAKAERLEQILFQSSEARLEKHVTDFNKYNYQELIEEVDLVADCLDSIYYRQLLNEACYKEKIPLVHAAVEGMKGRSITFTYEEGKPCLNCVYPGDKSPDQKQERTSILNTIVSLISSFQSSEIIKYLTKTGELNDDSLFEVDLKENEFEFVSIKPDSSCQVCQEEQFNLLSQAD